MAFLSEDDGAHLVCDRCGQQCRSNENHDCKELPRVIVLVEGGVAQAARASVPVNFEVLDVDNMKDVDEESDEGVAFAVLEAEYQDLPEAVY